MSARVQTIKCGCGDIGCPYCGPHVRYAYELADGGRGHLMSANVETIQPDGALCELHTDEPLGLVGARFRAHGVRDVHIEQRGRRRWLVANELPVQPADHVHIEDDTPATRRSQQAEVVALIGAAIVAAGLLAGAMGMWI